MAEEDDSSQEKTEEPTARKLMKAKEEGQVARSRELGTTLVLVAGTVGVLLLGGYMTRVMKDILTYNLDAPREALFDPKEMLIHFTASVVEIGVAVSPLLAIMFLAALLSPMLLGGWVFSGKLILPQLSRMSMLKGFKRMFGLNSLVELVKSILKIGVVLVIGYLLLIWYTEEILNLSRKDTTTGMKDAAWLVGWCLFLLSCSLIVISLIDVPYQVYDHNKKLRMTKQEVKDELKDTEGRPEVKQRVRQLQREMANRRMLEDVPKADVVITNPTHYAVALSYKDGQMSAPVLLAKGGDNMAFKIIEIAKEHKVTVVTAPPLARSIFHHTEIGWEIPHGLYVAVAQVLAYVFQLKRYMREGGPKPSVPDTPIPDDLRHE